MACFCASVIGGAASARTAVGEVVTGWLACAYAEPAVARRSNAVSIKSVFKRIFMALSFRPANILAYPGLCAETTYS